jgi:serine/threonine-protein kinase
MAATPYAAEGAVGAVLNGQWRLVRLVGEGGLAAVYEAESLAGLGRRAVKMLHQQFLGQRNIVERFYQEAQACFALRHPHIAGVEAYAYAEDGTPYLVMELLVGLSLFDYLGRGVPMRLEQAAPLLYAVLQALGVAHGRGIVHRDLKPANLFLVPGSAGEHTIKVLDFGVAKVMDVAGGMGSRTRTGALLGTPGYMSPEQVRDAKTVDSRSDLWAAGVVFYEMLTCQHPFGSGDQFSRMVAVLREEHTPPSRHAPALAPLDAFFARALARDPEARFHSAEEMAERLRALAQGTPARFVPEGMQTVALPQMSALAALAPQAEGGPKPLAKTVALAAAPAPIAVSYAAAPLAGAPGAPVIPTQISEERPPGTPGQEPSVPYVVPVVTAAPASLRIVWWAVLAIALGSFALGIVVGYLMGS